MRLVMCHMTTSCHITTMPHDHFLSHDRFFSHDTARSCDLGVLLGDIILLSTNSFIIISFFTVVKRG